MNRLLTFLLLLTVFLQPICAEKSQRKVKLWGHVMDSFTHHAIDSTFVTLLGEDSTFIDTTRTLPWRDAAYSFEVPAMPAKYIIKAEAKGYEPAFISYEVKYLARNTYFDMPWHYLKKQVSKSLELGEVVVKASKVKLVWRGDTMVFNADAFNVPEGSMLDELIKQLPGVELKKDGEILVNGRKVENLTLNGADFFKGNNKLMLENLPYYTVKDVRVFNKSTEESKFLGYDKSERQLTMDVRLKRQYNKGYIANAEVAGGTNERWLTRLFGVRFTDHSRVTLYGNMNNANETSQPSSDGDMDVYSNPTGTRTHREVSANIYTEDGDSRWTNNFATNISGDITENESTTASASYLEEANTFSRSGYNSRNKSFTVYANNSFRMMKPTSPIGIYSYITFNYDHSRNSSGSRSAMFGNDPEQMGSTTNILDSVFTNGFNANQHSLVNTTLSQSLGKGHGINTQMFNNFWWKLPWGDVLLFELNGNYRNRDDNNFNHTYYDYYNGKPNDHRNQYTDIETEGYNFAVALTYSISLLSGWHLGFRCTYSQGSGSNINPVYRLERNTLWQSANPALGALPAYLDSLIDVDNSLRFNDFNRLHTASVSANYNKSEEGKSDSHLDFSVDYNIVRNREHYVRKTTDAYVYQRKQYFAPSIHYSYNDIKHNIYFSTGYNMDYELPNINNLVGFTDEANPLSIRIGNPDLKPSRNHTLAGYASKNWPKRDRNLSFYCRTNIQTDNITTSYTYNSHTGAYTYKDVNVNGTWGIAPNVYFSTALDSAKHWNITSSAGVNYSTNVFFGSTGAQSDLNASKIKNYTWNWRYDLNLKFAPMSKFEIAALGNINYNHTTSSVNTYKNVNVYGFNYGFSMTWKMPLGFNISTSTTMCSQRGYEDNRMNKDYLMCNAQISRSFLKKKQLTVRLVAYDIFAQMTNTDYNISSTGYSNTWQRSLPRYVMLYVGYKINVTPKGR